MSRMGNRLFPAVTEGAMWEATHSACGFQRGNWAGKQVVPAGGQHSGIFRINIFIFYLSWTSLQREIWTRSWQRSPGHRKGCGFSKMMTKSKIKIISFLITLARSVTCGQGWQVVAFSIFYQIKQIDLMGLSHILDFPVYGCDLVI